MILQSLRLSSFLLLAATLPPAPAAQTSLWEYEPDPLELSFGSNLWSLDDVNEDGIHDLLVGSPKATFAGLQEAGLVTVLSGLDGGLVYSLAHPTPGTKHLFGNYVADLGDLDGDGMGDFGVVSPGFTIKGTSVSRFTIFSGKNGTILHEVEGTPDSKMTTFTKLGLVDADLVPDYALARITKTEIRSGTDHSVIQEIWKPSWPYSAIGLPAAVGDANGDGLIDLALVINNGFAQDLDRVDVYTALTGQWISSQQGTIPGLGASLSGAGDIDGDGLGDYVAGQGGNPEFLWQVSDAVLVDGATGEIRFHLPQLKAYDHTGWVTRGGQDLDGDGRGDVLVSSPAYSTPDVKGVVRAFSGRTGLELFRIDGDPTWLLPGGISPVAMFPDLDGDDFPEFALGFWDLPGCYPCPGKVVMYSGAPEGVTAFGEPCAGSSGEPPRIGCTWSAKLSGTWSVNLSRTIGGAPALIAAGTSKSSWLGASLPLALTGIGMPACELLVAPQVVTPLLTSTMGPIGSGAGWAEVPFAVPGGAELLGSRIYVQAWIADPSPASPGGAVTRALEVEILAP